MAAASGPLAGVRVVEFGGIGPGPFCAMLLADLGADVVRLDRPGAPPAGYADPRQDLLNRGKRSVTADLKQPAGVARALALAERAHIVVEGFRPGVAERLGVGPRPCQERNPRLVYGRMTGWGQDGPLAGRAGHDITYLAVTGVLHAIGPAAGPPQIPLNLVGDFGGGALYLAVGLLAALRHAEDTGRGQVVDAAIVDGASHLAMMMHGMLAAGRWRDERHANLTDGGMPFYDVYETADGRYMAVGPIEPQFLAELLDRLGLPAADRTADPERLRAALSAAFAGRTRQQWTEIFAGSDACVAPVLSWREAPGHPQLAARGTFETRDGVRQPAAAPRFSATPAVAGRPPPRPGEHDADVLADWGVTG